MAVYADDSGADALAPVVLSSDEETHRILGIELTLAVMFLSVASIVPNDSGILTLILALVAMICASASSGFFTMCRGMGMPLNDLLLFKPSPLHKEVVSKSMSICVWGHIALTLTAFATAVLSGNDWSF